MGITFQLDADSGPDEYNFRPDPKKSWAENWRAELAEYYADLKTLNEKDPVSAFQTLSSLSARVSELRAQCMDMDGVKANSFRTRYVDPFLEECDRQFKIHSRIHAIREMEFKLSGRD